MSELDKKMKIFRRLTNIVIVAGLFLGAIAMAKMINIERGVNEVNRKVLEEAYVQNSIMEEMIPQFQASEEAYRKNEDMMPLIEDLNATMGQINDLLARTNLLVADSADLMRLDNEAMARLNSSIAASVGPLAWTNQLTLGSCDLADISAAMLGQMNGDMQTQNVHAASIAEKMEGNY